MFVPRQKRGWIIVTKELGSFADFFAAKEISAGNGKLITTQLDLLELQPRYKRLRVDLVGSTAAAKVCPAELEDNTLVLLCTPEQVDKDLHNSLKELLSRELGAADVRTYQITPVMLLTLVREGVDGQRLAGSRSARGRDSSDVSRAFRDIIGWCIRQGASDIHLNIHNDSPNSQIHVHIDGHYIAPPHLSLPTPRLTEIARVAWLDVVGGQQPVFDPRSEQQGRLYEVVDGTSYMLRWGSFVGDRGPSITLRLLNLDETIDGLTLESLGYLPSHIEKLQRAQRSEGGAIVLGGVVGSGKSTTIAKLLSDLPTNRKIMTLEDPVERIIRHAIQSSIVRNLASTDDGAFRRKLMMLKRSAVSDVLLGEIRDTDTGQAFQDIVESGSNLYTTVHVYSMLGIPDRLASRQVGVPIDLLASPGILKLLVYQALLPRLCEHCSLPIDQLRDGHLDALGHKRSLSHWKEYIERLKRIYGSVEGIRIRNEEGCQHCKKNELSDLYGYTGRTVVAELFELGHHVEALRCVRNKDSLALLDVYESLSDGDPRSQNMDGKTAMDCAAYKMLSGQIDPRDVEPRFIAFETLETKKNVRRAT